jgi:hypothetical protein
MKNSALKIFDKHPHPKNLPFGMVVSHIRRKHMMTALKIGSPNHQALRKENFNQDDSYFNKFDDNFFNNKCKETFKANERYDE